VPSSYSPSPHPLAFPPSLLRLDSPSTPCLRACLPPLPLAENLNQEPVAQAKAKGYQRRAHEEKDTVQNRHKHADKAKEDHDAALGRCVL
jgi:hypothetical protein